MVMVIKIHLASGFQFLYKWQTIMLLLNLFALKNKNNNIFTLYVQNRRMYVIITIVNIIINSIAFWCGRVTLFAIQEVSV